jgi:hypothetical protein
MSLVGLMESKRIEIDGEIFDLSDPSGKKAAVRAWLQARSLQRSAPDQASSPQETLPADETAEPTDPVKGDT